MGKSLLLATKNQGKIREFKALLENTGWFVSSLKDFPGVPVVEEKGSSFLENALEKARIAAMVSGRVALADDSGLEVDALGGAPGVRSARWGGEGLSDEERNRLLLDRLEGIPMEKRGARFRCVIAMVTPDSKEYTVEGICEGYIAFEPKGESGFGYDPVFFLPSHNRTMAQLLLEEKNKISHRAKALEKIKKVLLEHLEACT